MPEQIMLPFEEEKEIAPKEDAPTEETKSNSYVFAEEDPGCKRCGQPYDALGYCACTKPGESEWRKQYDKKFK